MAQTYKVSGCNITTIDTYSGIYTCPASTTAMVNSVYIGNTGAGNTAVTMKFSDNSASQDSQLMTNVLVPEQATLQPFAAPLVLEQNDAIYAKDLSGFLHVVVSVLEIT